MTRLAEAISLRPYQITALDELRARIKAGRKRIVLIAPTGSGKTVMASAMIHAALAKSSRALVIAHRRELIDQTLDKLSQWGVSAGVIMANDRRADSYLPVQVASVQTLVRRLDRKPAADLVIVDECHHACSETYRRVVDAYSGAVVIGLTATPWRSDKFGLADIYEDSVLASTPAELMRGGALVEYDASAWDAPDLHEVKMSMGDFNQKDLGIACNTNVLVGSVVREYLAHAAGRRAILFPVNIAHSQHLVAEFVAAGVTAEHVDCDTPGDVRSAAMTRFRHGDLMVLSSVGVLTEGFDAPSAEVCILARPTKSLTLFLQMVGRVLRPSPETGKTRALVHDHSGNMLRHGLVEDTRDYSLTATSQRVRALHTCPLCHAIFTVTRNGNCPKCGELIAPPEDPAGRGPAEEKITVEGRRISKAEIAAMRERGIRPDLTDRQVARAVTATRAERAAEYLRLQDVAKRKGFKAGFASHQYRETFGVWPRFAAGDLDGVSMAERPFFPLKKREDDEGRI